MLLSIFIVYLTYLFAVLDCYLFFQSTISGRLLLFNSQSPFNLYFGILISLFLISSQDLPSSQSFTSIFIIRFVLSWQYNCDLMFVTTSINSIIVF